MSYDVLPEFSHSEQKDALDGGDLLNQEGHGECLTNLSNH